MLSGNLLWDERYTEDMRLVRHRERYCLTYADLPATMDEALRTTAATYPDKTALVDEYGRACTYADLMAKTDACAALLADRFSVRKGTRVGFLLYNSLEFAVVFLALCRLGALAVPLPTKYKREELEALMDRARLGVLIHDAEFSWLAEACTDRNLGRLACVVSPDGYGLDVDRCGLHPAPAPRHSSRRTVSGRQSPSQRPGLHDDCILMFTSGTTSFAKGVLLSNFNLMHSVVTYKRLLQVGPDDVSIIPMPMYHITGLAALLCLFIHVGGTLYLHRRFNARRVLEDVREKGVTLIHASPTIFIKMLAEKETCPALPRLKQLACGSSNMPVKYLRALKAWLPNISFRTIYGLTETCSPASVFPGDAASSHHIGSSGMPIPGLLMKVVDEGGRELPNGQTGELLIRGSVVMEEYDGLDEGFVEDHWFRSGDLARLTDDGFVYITDRKKDMINRAGEKVWSYEIENLLHDCPGVAEAAVVGVPDEVYG
ncbi:MAG: acyl--CoA ligase, partial [Planctomycetes bacterium]|nr:acyl--CoA ligase [Planctomycetota bacterium]